MIEMGQHTFADRYAEAGLSPSAQLITERSESAKRIIETITTQKILDLAEAYYESPSVDLVWLRDEFLKDDASFSLVNNEREVRVLAAVMLEQLAEKGRNPAILSVLAGNVVGNRKPAQSEWLVGSTKQAFGILSVQNRVPSAIEKIIPTVTKDIVQEITNSASEGDTAKLGASVIKARNEAVTSAKSTSAQANKAFEEIDRQMDLLREETQMLWWLFGGHSRLLEKPFSGFDPYQAALVAAIDLGTLTDYSALGPIAAPAMLERVITLAKKIKGASTRELSTTIDSLPVAELERLQINTNLPARLAPVTTAIELARTLGEGAWHARFKSLTGFDASISFGPLPLAEQLYREHLLGQLL